MTRTQIKELLITQNKPIRNYINFLKKHNITEEFDSYRVYDDEPYREVAYRVKNDIYERVLCQCGNPVNYDSGKYHEFCSTSCNYNKETTISKLKSTNIKRYGTDNPMKVDSIKKKFKRTMIDTYGFEHALQVKDIMNRQMNTKLDRFGGYTTEYQRDVARETMKQSHNDGTFKNAVQTKYGVDNIMQTGITPKYRHKDYTMPSGKVIKIQGYENLLIDELLLEYNESDILTDRVDMPEFWYEYKGKKHRYFPDVYVKSNNTIYEVKSHYTLNKDYDRNLLKFNSVKESNYEFVLMIY